MIRSMRWIALGVGVLVVLAGGYAALNGSSLKARYTASQLRSASNPEAKTTLANQLLQGGEAAWPYVLAELRSDTGDTASVLGEALCVQLQHPDATNTLAPKVLEECGSFSTSAKAKLLGLVPTFLKLPNPEAAAKCRELVRGGFASENPEIQVQAIRLSLRPEIQLPAEIVPLLKAKNELVRRIAMLAVGPVNDEQTAVIGTEELFPWLHDSDAEVRQICRAALLTRGLDSEQIGYAQLLSDPRATERLKLLADLRFASSTGSVGQWLERLSRDSDPAVRIGAARVASEMQLRFASWMTRLAEQDADQVVRRWASYYKQETRRIEQTGFER